MVRPSLPLTATVLLATCAAWGGGPRSMSTPANHTTALIAAPAPQPTTRPIAAVTPPAKTQFHIYLLMGQSNMVGRDIRTLNSQVDNPRILAFNPDGQWVVAHEPMHAGGTGIGPGIPFAAEMLKSDPSVTIGLVPCAVGGTGLNRWVKGADLYEKAVSRGLAAAQAGMIKGVLWHQGESDAGKSDAAAYEARLTQMFKDLRRDLGLPNVPIVVGQLGEFLTADKYPSIDTVRTAIRHLPSDLPEVAFADSAGLGDRGDKLHFAADAQAQFGIRYATAMLEAQKQREAAAKPAAVLDLWPEGKMPGQGAKEPESEMPARGDDARRITNISRPSLSFFPAKTKNAPAMIVCPGGGYSYVVYDKEGTEIANWLNSLGITAAVLKYRTPNNRAGAFQDAQRALSLAREHAAEWNIDPHRLGIIGFSAGGNLGAKASTLFDKRSYSPIDAADQQSCRPDFAVLVYPAYLEKDGKIAADLDLTAKIPPTLIVHSDDDKTFAPGSKIYNAALDAGRIPHEYLLYPTGGHGYGLRCTRDAKAWPDAAANWLEKHGFR